MRLHLLVAAALSALVAVCLSLGAPLLGPVASSMHPAGAAGSHEPANVCVTGQTRCTPTLPLGSPATAPASARLAVVVAAGLGAVALIAMVFVRRRRPGALASGLRAALFRPPRLSTVV